MFEVLRTVFICLAGAVLGAVVNMALITAGPAVIPPPVGVDVTNVESIAANIHLYQFRHFVFPFLAHALGTLTGAFLVASLFKHRKARGALFIGVVFLVGGITAAFMIPAPIWFIVVDLGLAYLPMAWLGLALARRLSRSKMEAGTRS